MTATSKARTGWWETPGRAPTAKERYYEAELLAKVTGFNKEPLRHVERFDTQISSAPGGASFSESSPRKTSL
jgi:hypothetical protein